MNQCMQRFALCNASAMCIVRANAGVTDVTPVTEREGVSFRKPNATPKRSERTLWTPRTKYVHLLYTSAV